MRPDFVQSTSVARRRATSANNIVGGAKQRRRWLCASGWEVTKKEPVFGGALQKMETGSDFAIGLMSSPRWEQDTDRKCRPSNDRAPDIKTER